jgi:peptide-methionine (S)-S-oxide reductase
MALSKSRWSVRIAVLGGMGIVAAILWRSPLVRADAAVALAPPAVDNPKSAGAAQAAVFAGGCFWGVQGVFEHVRGVQKVVSGYAGGEAATAQYETVSTGATGHAESVKIIFDPGQISYGQLLQIAFSVAFDPTQLNRQGPDSGTQYRSEIFYADESQRNIASAYIDQLTKSRAFPRPIVTRVDPLKAFFAAEDYHQDYLFHHPTEPYIAIYDLPKVQNLKRVFPELYNEQPMLTGVAIVKVD